MDIIETTMKMMAEDITVITNPLYLQSELADKKDEYILKMRKEDGQLLPAAQQELSLRGDRIAFIEFHRYMYGLSDIKIAELKQGMKQFYYDEKLGDCEYKYCDQSLLEDAIDYHYCLRGGKNNFSPDICGEIAISFKNNTNLALQYPDIDSNCLIKLAKLLLNKYHKQGM